MTGSPHHDTDFYGWTQDQAARLRTLPAGAHDLDRDHLAEEIEDLGEAAVFRVSSLLRRTLIPLIKIAALPDTTPPVAHWYDEAITFQGDAVLAYSPGLRQRVDLTRIWTLARNGAARSLAVQGDTVPDLPQECPLTLDDLLSPELDPREAVERVRANH